MKKALVFSGLGCSALFAGVFWLMRRHKKEHRELVKQFMESRHGLKHCSDTIAMLDESRPQEIVYAADRGFVEALDQAIRYMDTSPKYLLKMTCDDITKLPNSTLYGFVNCIEDVLRVANELMEDALIAQQGSIGAHRQDV